MRATGLVVARFRRHALVEDRDGDVYDCRMHGPPAETGGRRQRGMAPRTRRNLHRASVHSRDSTLRRVDSRSRPEVIAANLTQLIMVWAPHPAPDWFLLDRYLCAAELEGLKAVIAYNKMDLTDIPPEALQVYRKIGYGIVLTSAPRQERAGRASTGARAERSALIGQSGVGQVVALQ